ncbi:MAG: glutamate--tRNA ligase family protein, partial [Candidatus Aureabacteria bacterium]|nr:glutamate--tRNA ligase family protein [Candidatus Auribacterota bacterium]
MSVTGTTRVRFAPSPTGLLHIGNARTALFNWAYARATGGVFILRIEDTDGKRSTAESARAIMDDLRWLGLEWDEGPGRGGPCGPYLQSQRGEIYRSYAQRLREEGRAYPCYCTAEELDARRRESLHSHRAPRYDNRCRGLGAAETARYEREGRVPALRFRVDPQTLSFDDAVRGTVTVDTALIGDFVILRSDGTPSF